MYLFLFRILEKHLRVVHGEGEGSEGEPDDTVSEEVKLIKVSAKSVSVLDIVNIAI